LFPSAALFPGAADSRLRRADAEFLAVRLCAGLLVARGLFDKLAGRTLRF